MTRRPDIPFAIRNPVPRVDPDDKKRRLAQTELEESAGQLVTSTACQLTKDEQHRKRLKTELDRSTAVPQLLQSHLGWVSSLPECMQLGVLLGEKWIRTRMS